MGFRSQRITPFCYLACMRNPMDSIWSVRVTLPRDSAFRGWSLLVFDLEKASPPLVFDSKGRPSQGNFPLRGNAALVFDLDRAAPPWYSI